MSAKTSAIKWLPFRDQPEEVDPMSLIMQAALGESPQMANELAKEWHDYKQVVRDFWIESAETSLQRSLWRSQDIQLEDEDLLRYFMKDKSQGLVLLTIHMGDYLHAILRMLSLTKCRDIVVLRRKAWTEAEHNSFAKLEAIGHRLHMVRHGPRAAKTIIKHLRQGAIAILLCDLPARWGATQPVSIFNQQLNWVVGPMQLAMLGKSCVVPFFCYEDERRWHCELDSIRDYRQLTGDRSIYLQREIQRMAFVAEGIIRRYVTQWNHWDLLPEMLQVEQSHG